MKTRIHTNLLMNWLMSAVLLIAATGCSEKNDDVVPPTDGNEVKTRQLVITQVEDNAATKSALTRATLTENGSTLAASWNEGDELTYGNLNQTTSAIPRIVTGSLTATQTAAFSQFTGSVTCAKGDAIAVVYPTTTFTLAKEFSIDLTGQTGDLDDVATRFHYVYGVATVTDVTESTATASMGQMKSLLTLCKFSFTDGSAAIPISTLEISYGGENSDRGTYPQTVVLTANDTQEAVSAVNAADGTSKTPLEISCPLERDNVYVAMIPTSEERIFIFTVINSSGTYTGTARAQLNEGEYIEAKRLKLTKQP